MEMTSTEPLDIALREISATKHLLETLITSSESFDYPKAKSALQLLEKKVRLLAKHQSEWQRQKLMAHPQLRPVDFRAEASRLPRSQPEA